ncbi:patatin-like phospholipase family protein [Methylocapsa sp. S129]|uniref:patatin-like phospholipase family protein n=1 Tax=Methylocapsa sp. S129 TaxID=1641869 RepID=UPI00131D82B0|nr:patatin-like phospholipase family protein [Methylocapsa sp. S129]
MSLASKTALVLAGGGSLGAVQAGMLGALMAAGEPIDFIVGASVGAINAGYFAADPSLTGARKLQAIWRGITRNDVMPLTLATAMNIVRRRGYLFDNHALRVLLERHIPYKLLEQAAIPVHVVATDVLTGQEVVLSQGPVVEAILASAAIPGVFPPMLIDGRALVDGGIADNTPISTAIRLGATRLLVLPTGFACALRKAPTGVAARAMHGISQLVSRQLVNDVERYADKADICVVPSLCPLEISPYDFSACASLVDQSEANTRAWIAAGGLQTSGAPESLLEHTH